MPSEHSGNAGSATADDTGRAAAYLAILSHELRNRLAPIRLTWEVVRQAGGDAHPAQQTAAILDHQLAGMVQLVDDAHEVSQIAAGALTLQRARIDGRYVIEQQAQAAVRLAAARGVDLHTALPDQPVEVEADAERLGQALSRLLTRAIASTAAGGAVLVSARNDGAGLEVRIRQAGRGVPPEPLERTFHALPSSDPACGARELGIEVVLALRLIRLHGGTVRAAAEQEPPATEIVVGLPLAQGSCRAHAVAPTAPAALRPAAQEPAAASASDEQPAAEPRPRIFLVDDNPYIREYVGSLLRVHWQVDVFGNGAAALEAARAGTPDLVLTDIVMPELDGFGLLEALRRDPQTRAVPVIMLSGRGAEEARVEGLEAGADDYLVKPFGTRELLARVRTHLTVARLRREAVEAAKHDPLTGLANRAQGYAFAEAIFARARRSGTQAAVLVIDLDRFKPINDTYGHEVGDAVLQEVARRLKRSVRGEDVVARLGGDEFLAVLSGVRSTADAAYACAHIIRSLDHPIQVRGLQLRTSPSIGVSIFPDDGHDVAVLAKNADMAMYHAKQNRRNSFHFFTPELDRRAARIQSIEARLRHSMDQQEFVLNYQPIVDLASHTVEGVEALMRWPGTGIGPDEFIPIAEMAGVIEQLGEWAVRECCEQVRRWLAAGLPRMTVSINVSPLQFRHAGLLPAITQAVDRYGLDPSQVQLELTETALLHDTADAIAHMQAIKRYGLKLALDDFGKGYSSLHYIGSLPLDAIKVDQSFVRRLKIDLASAVVTDAVIAIGRSLGLKVVAEGIESAEVLQALAGRDCHRVQGNFICPPLPGAELAGWYRRWTASPGRP